MLSKNFWSSKRAESGEGLGIVNKNIMVHYGAEDVDGHVRDISDWEHEREIFQKHVSDQIITELPEGQFIVVTQDARLFNG